MGVKILGGNEPITNDVAVITTDHKYIHYGAAHITTIVTGTLTKAGGVEKVRFKTPSDKFVHWRPIAGSSTADIAKIELYEGATFTDNGTSLVPVNRNRTMAVHTSQSTLGTDATTSDDGLLLASFTIGSGGKKDSASGGSVSGEADEIVFEQDTEYLIVITNIGTVADTVVYMGLGWYEEDLGSAH